MAHRQNGLTPVQAEVAQLVERSGSAGLTAAEVARLRGAHHRGAAFELLYLIQLGAVVRRLEGRAFRYWSTGYEPPEQPRVVLPENVPGIVQALEAIQVQLAVIAALVEPDTKDPATAPTGRPRHRSRASRRG